MQAPASLLPAVVVLPFGLIWAGIRDELDEDIPGRGSAGRAGETLRKGTIRKGSNNGAMKKARLEPAAERAKLRSPKQAAALRADDSIVTRLKAN